METKILVVDDEVGITNSLVRYFSLMGYDVVASNHPEEALEMIYKDNYMVVISDIMMPGMSGTELLLEIKRYNGMIQVIMMTGVVTIENVLMCLRDGANECFLKPLDDLESVKKAVDEAIEKLNKWERLIKTMVKRKE
ncbi:MAG: response regulator [Nitrospinota bacterium]|nr:response regulator [Nitrospinota bacterium]MDH5678212.1 response regulator [Nitrospinota bacterium]MDH5756065.1 response regulator [Nitrospinota bacterium]